MVTGLRARTDAGLLQIDADVPQLKLFTKYTATGEDTRTINNLPGIPAVAVACSTGAYVVIASYSNGSATIKTTVFPSSGGTATVYVYSRPQPGNPGGIKLNDAAGQLTFDGSPGYLKIVGSTGGTPTNNGVENNVVNFPAGRTYAALVRQVGYNFRDVNQGSAPSVPDWYRYVFRGFTKISGTQFSVVSYNYQIARFGTSAPVDATPFITGQSCWVVDVTGL
ncbi:hypothetical protein EA660_20095 [Pseudoxanthomonas winnipegensis]|uniref:Uncharacterized protein n=1 Tax=Pseudoxanthomonas winnipegensis TaxID=2480810 RepID=A0A4Q8L403_9GAMM|nr:hypothetical protein EA660_20095 [Pseudoxanthomonas winnipegensis]